MRRSPPPPPLRASTHRPPREIPDLRTRSLRTPSLAVLERRPDAPCCFARLACCVLTVSPPPPCPCRKSVQDFADKPCLGRRTDDTPFVYETYAEVGAKVDKIGSALAANGIKPKDAVGVIGPNAPEWMVIMQGCNHQNAMCVPLYDTLGANAVEFILKHSGATAAFAEASKMKVLAEALPAVKGQVKFVGYWGEAAEDVKKVPHPPRLPTTQFPLLLLLLMLLFPYFFFIFFLSFFSFIFFCPLFLFCLLLLKEPSKPFGNAPSNQQLAPLLTDPLACSFFPTRASPTSA